MRLLPCILFGSVVVTGCGLISTAAPLCAQEPAGPAVGSPEWIVDRFFAQKEFPELERYATGEFAELYKRSPTLGSIVPASVTVSSRVLERDAQHVHFGITMTDNNVSKEWYAYLRSAGGAWKLEAIRTLTLGAKFFETLVAAEKGALAGRLNALGIQELERSHLTIASDAELKAHFVAQKPLFDALAKEFAAATAIDVVNFDARIAPPEAVTPEKAGGLALQLRALTLGAAIRKYRDCAGCVVFIVGGDGENQVGYLYAGPGAQVPRMSPLSFIYVEAVAPGWYLFKTV